MNDVVDFVLVLLLAFLHSHENMQRSDINLARLSS